MVHKLIWLLLCMFCSNESAKILGIFPMPSFSHQKFYQSVMKALVVRGHEVTVIGTNPLKEPIANYTDVDISFSYKFHKDDHNFEDMIHLSAYEFLYSQYILQPKLADYQLSSPELQEFIMLSNTIKYDLVFIEELLFPCYYGLVHHLGSPPVIAIAPALFFCSQVGDYASPENPSYVPSVLLPYTDSMSFLERLQNTLFFLFARFMTYTIMFPENERIMRKHFGPEPPSIMEAMNNKSLFLVGTSLIFNYPVPLPPSIVTFRNEINQMMLDPLPKDLQRFLDDAPNGIIYLSFGSNVHSARMPKDKIYVFLDVFSELPQKVLWKWESDVLPAETSKVKFDKWFPQPEVLAHENTKLFITHCGLQSLHEAIYNAVPMLAFPFFADQIFNAKKVEREKIGMQFPFLDISKDTLLKAINAIINDSRNNAKRFSALSKDHPDNGIEKAVWWTEYVLRHKGAKHLQSARKDLDWHQYLLLDVLASIIFAIIVIICIFSFFIRTLYNYFYFRFTHYLIYQH